MSDEPSGISRTFFDLPIKDSIDAEEYAFLRGFSREGTLDWEELLRADRVLIVSEAGMGKTHECQQQQKRLWEAGEAAFFLELADLAPEGLARNFDPAERERFEHWRSAQSERAIFFLDSIDELKLTSRSFQGTLKRFAVALGSQLGRACIVLTTRPGTDDREAVERLLPIPREVPVVVAEDVFVEVALRQRVAKEAESQASSRWRYVALAPLDSNQQQALARNYDVFDPKALQQAIEAEHAQEFAKRPLDFIELCEDWNATGRIRGHRDQIESSIAVKLKPNPERNEPAQLSARKAREGAERLALAALLTRRFALWYGKDTDRGRGNGALDPALVLSDWTPAEVKTLLERPLFGFATYSRVRFQNRSIIEYLAAERLRALTERGLSIRTLHRLLFVTTPEGVLLVRPTMQPVAAWLAASQPTVLSELLERDPSLLLRHGDPAALDPATRAKSLERYVDVFGNGGWRGMHIPALQARRLASPALSPVIEQLWERGIENPEIRETLLELIEIGRLVDNSDVAFEAASDVERYRNERLAALQALAAIGDPRLPTLLDRMAARESGWTGALATAAIVHLFPGAMTVPQLLGTLAGLTHKRREFDGISYYLPTAISRAELSADRLDAMRVELTALVARDKAWDPAAYRIKTDRRDLVTSLIRVCELQVRDHVTPESVADSIALVLQLSREDDYQDDTTEKLRGLLATASSRLRSAVIWAQERLVTAIMPGKDADDGEMRMLWPPAMALAATDAPWLQNALADTTRSLAQRSVALKALVHCVRREDVNVVTSLYALRSFVADSSELTIRLEEFISPFENPPPPDPWLAEQNERAEKRRRKKEDSRVFWVEFYRSLLVEPAVPLDEEAKKNLAWRLTEVMAMASRDSNYAGWNRGFLESVFDKAQVERLRELIVGIWRTVKPTLPSEREEGEKNLYYTIWRVGLAGLYAEAEHPDWARQLDAVEAELAMRYAVTSMHDLPAWVDALAAAHPGVVRDMLRPELEAQLGATDPQQRHSSMLQSLARGGPTLLALMLDDVRKWVSDVLAAGVGTLHEADKFERAIEILLDKGIAADVIMLRSAAQRHVQANTSPASVLFWLPLLMRLSPVLAVEEMERLAGTIAPTAQSAVTQWFGILFGHNARRGAVTQDLIENPVLLARLAVLAYQHVRTEDDLSREGRHESNSRDDAEFARSQLVSALFKTKGTEAWREKLRFIENPLVKHFRDRGVALATQNLAEEWDAPIYSLADLALLEQARDVPPVTRADMAAMLLDRLDQLDDRLREDSSPRKTWAGIREETELRRGIAGEMERLAKGAYSVGQEQTTAEENETDVRLRSSGYEMEAVIELKIGENDYSYKDLSKALRDQLLGRYMAPEARRVGCLMISIATDRRWKHPKDDHLIDMEEVVLLLRHEAEELSSSLGFASLLEVRALDLRPKKLA